MTTKAPELVLQVHVSFLDSTRIRVDIRAENRSSGDLYWLDKIWTMLKGGKMGWEPRAPYRYEKAGILRLLYGVAPTPPNTQVNNRYIPQATRIPPGGAAEEHVELALPVEEFAPFQPPNAQTEYELVEVDKVAVIAHYVAPGEGIVIAPSFVDPAYFWVKAPDQKVRVAEAVVTAEKKIAVRRRKDEIARVLLAGEVP
jgi:hypothetical protein